MKKTLIVSLAIFTLFFWLWRIPFILWLPLPEFGPDTFDYFSLVQAFQNKTELSCPVNLPLAFPLLVCLTGVISNKIIVIIWVQFLLKFSAGLLLLYAFCKHYSRIAIFAALVLSIYVTDSWSLRYDTGLIPDSLYNSFLMIAVASLILSLKSFSNISLAMFSISMFLVAFTRSNGIFIYFLVPVMIVILLKSNQRLIKFASLLAPAIILHLCFWGFQSFSGIHPAKNRLAAVINREAGSLKSANGASYFNRKWNMSKEYFHMADFPSFYFSLLPSRYYATYEIDMIHDPDYKMYDWTTPISDELRKLVFKEYYNEPEVLKRNKRMMEVYYAYSHPLFFAIHVLYKIQSVVFRNILWYILFFAVLIFLCWRYMKSSFSDKDALLFILLCAVHLLGFLSVVFGHDRAIERYVHVSEFLLYLSPIFALTLALPHFRHKNSQSRSLS